MDILSAFERFLYNLRQEFVTSDDLSSITELIPNEASSSNQLADKDFVTDAVNDGVSPINEVIPDGTTTSNKLINMNQLTDAIDQQLTEYIASDSSMVVPFEYCTAVGQSDVNLENGPWYKMGVEAGSGSPAVYVTKNDYAVVLQDESVCYFWAYGYRYQRHKDGGATPFGYAVLPDANQTHAIIQQAQGGLYDGALYFVDNSHVFSQNDIYFIVTNLRVLQNSVVETTSLSDAPINTYDLRFPTTRYVCTTSQTDVSNPVWSFAYFVSDEALTAKQVQALDSGITSELVSQISDNSDAISNLSEVAFSGSYDDLKDTPTIQSISVSQSDSATGSNPSYKRTTITIDGVGTNIDVPKVTTAINTTSHNPVESRIIHHALSQKVDSADFDSLNNNAILRGGKVKDTGSGVQGIFIESTYNVYGNTTSGTAQPYRIVYGKDDATTYFAIYNVEDYDTMYFTATGISRAMLCLTNDVTAQEIDDLIESVTLPHPSSDRTLATYTTVWSYLDNNASTVDNLKIDNPQNAKTLIVYMGNTCTSYILTAGDYVDAFDLELDPNSTNAVQNQAIYAKFNEMYNEFPLVRDENSQYSTSLKTLQGYVPNSEPAVISTAVLGEDSLMSSSLYSTITGNFCHQDSSQYGAIDGETNSASSSRYFNIYGTTRESTIIASEYVFLHGTSSNSTSAHCAIIASNHVGVGAYGTTPPSGNVGDYNVFLGSYGDGGGTVMRGKHGLFAATSSYSSSLIHNSSTAAAVIATTMSGPLTVYANNVSVLGSNMTGSVQVGSSVSSGSSSEHGLSIISSVASGVYMYGEYNSALSSCLSGASIYGKYNAILSSSYVAGTMFQNYDDNTVSEANTALSFYYSGHSVSGSLNIVGATRNNATVNGYCNVSFGNSSGGLSIYGDSNAALANNGSTTIYGDNNLFAASGSGCYIGNSSSDSVYDTILSSYGLTITSNYSAAIASQSGNITVGGCHSIISSNGSNINSGSNNSIIASQGTIDGYGYNSIISSSGCTINSPNGSSNVIIGASGAYIGGDNINFAFASGSNVTVSASYSHAEGLGTLALGKSQHVFGEYNIGDTLDYPDWVSGTSYAVGDNVKYDYKFYTCSTANSDTEFDSSNWTIVDKYKYVEIVGNGRENNSRSNARTLDWEGNEYLSGNLIIGGEKIGHSNSGISFSLNSDNNDIVRIDSVSSQGASGYEPYIEIDPGLNYSGSIVAKVRHPSAYGAYLSLDNTYAELFSGTTVVKSYGKTTIQSQSLNIEFNAPSGVNFIGGPTNGIKKAISTTSCTPDTYYCPTSNPTNANPIVFDDTDFTGNYNYTFSGYFTNGNMTDMPMSTESGDNIDWRGDIGLENGAEYMFVATKVSDYDYIGIVTKIS